MFVFGKQYAGGVCEIYKNDLHKHAAYFIALGKTADITVIDKYGEHHTASTILIKPMIEHCIVASSSLFCHLFIAPQSAFAASLGQLEDEAGIVKLTANALPFNNTMSDQEIFDALDKVMEESNTKIDSRLAAVLEDLDKAPIKTTLVDIAKRYDISASRLRVIAKEQIGVSLSTLLVWRKLIKAMQTLSLGSTLSEAAQSGGFSDQAHFTRTMHRMFGVTPSNSTEPLGCQK